MRHKKLESDASTWIIWVDSDLLAVNKPAGLLTLPDGYDRNALHLKKVLEPEFGRLWIAHRLDRETSGVIVLARNALAHRHLNAQFEQHALQKIYHALVIGSPAWQEMTVNMPLRTNVGHRHRSVFDLQQGKPAVTQLKVLERFRKFTLIEACPETGRTHQIRAHLYALDLPIAADTLYSGGERLDLMPGITLMERPALHAWELELTHPGNQKSINLHAPYPGDLANALLALRQA